MKFGVSTAAMGCTSSKGASQGTPCSPPSLAKFDGPAGATLLTRGSISDSRGFGQGFAIEKPVVLSEGRESSASPTNSELECSPESREVFQSVEVAVKESLHACRARLDLGDANGAEVALAQVLRQVETSRLSPHEVRLLLDFVRTSPEYKEALDLLREMEAVAEAALGNDGEDGAWKLGSEVKVDYAALGFPVDEAAAKILLPDHDIVKIYYRLDGKRLDIKVSAVIPTKSPTALPILAGMAAMYHETGLWDTWHPVMMGKGPIELRKRGPYHNLWHLPQKVMMRKVCELAEERMFFVRDAGIYMMAMDGRPASDELWRAHPAPLSCKPVPGYNQTRLVCVAQEHTTAASILTTVVAEAPIPEFFVKLAVSWLVPEILRRMLKAGSQCFLSGSPHAPCMDADSEGIYEECRRLAARGAELDALTGRGPYTPSNMPTPDVVKRRAGNVLAFEEDFVGGRVAWASAPSPAAKGSFSHASSAEALVVAVAEEAETEGDTLGLVVERPDIMIDDPPTLCVCACGLPMLATA